MLGLFNQMTDARCPRCMEKKVGVASIIQTAGHMDRYQVWQFPLSCFLLTTCFHFNILYRLCFEWLEQINHSIDMLKLHQLILDIVTCTNLAAGMQWLRPHMVYLTRCRLIFNNRFTHKHRKTKLSTTSHRDACKWQRKLEKPPLVVLLQNCIDANLLV